MGQTINVEFCDHIAHEESAYGFACYNRNLIQIQRSVNGVRRTQEQIEQTFLHELVHFILYYANTGQYDERLSSNEALVDLAASLLHQALTTMETK
jgi:hypothetical protein